MQCEASLRFAIGKATDRSLAEGPSGRAAERRDPEHRASNDHGVAARAMNAKPVPFKALSAEHLERKSIRSSAYFSSSTTGDTSKKACEFQRALSSRRSIAWSDVACAMGQQMLWGRSGADSVVQVRVAVQNREFDHVARQNFSWSGSRRVTWPWMQPSHPFNGFLPHRLSWERAAPSSRCWPREDTRKLATANAPNGVKLTTMVTSHG